MSGPQQQPASTEDKQPSPKRTRLPKTEIIFGGLSFKKVDQREWAISEAKVPQRANTPSAWFSNKFPAEAELYGPPILEYVSMDRDFIQHTMPISPNQDFFAAILGGQKKLGHQVVYFVPESQWYFYDPRLRYFTPTTEEKLKTVLSQYFVQCAQECSPHVNILRLVNDFRKEEVLDLFVRRARAILAVGEKFFSLESRHKRAPSFMSPQQAAHIFVEQMLVKVPGARLTFQDCYGAYRQFCEAKGYSEIVKGRFRKAIEPIIRQKYCLGYRRDVRGTNGKKQTGWIGLSLVA